MVFDADTSICNHEPNGTEYGRPARPGAHVSQAREELIRHLRENGLEHREEPFQLSSGEWSQDYVDGKRALADGRALQLAASVLEEIACAHDIDFNDVAVGGLTLGADHISHALAYRTGCRWFTVRKEPKKHGKQRLIEGSELRSGDCVVVVDDVVTTGKSILQAVDALEEVGAEIMLAITMIDRGDVAAAQMRRRGIPYEPVATYAVLGIAPVGGGTHAARAAG